MSRHRWEFDLEDGRHVVEFEQGYFLGNRKITVDGTRTTERGRPFMDHSGQYPVRLDGHGAAVWVTTNGFTYQFDLVVDGKSVTSGKTAGRVPRPARGGPKQMKASGLIAVAVAIPLAFIAWSQGFDEYRYRNASLTASAVVEDRWTSSGRYGTTYNLSYAFVDRAGAIWRGHDSVARATYDAARPGTTRVPVVYLRDDPNVSRLSGKDNVLTVILLTAAAIGTAGFGTYLIWAGRRDAAMIVRLNGVGQHATGTVTKVKKMFMKGVGEVVRVEYAYDDSFGRRRKGRGPLMYPSEGALYSVGGPVRILVDPDRPGDSAVP